jgi:hypothetical protein
MIFLVTLMFLWPHWHDNVDQSCCLFLSFLCDYVVERFPIYVSYLVSPDREVRCLSDFAAIIWLLSFNRDLQYVALSLPCI